MIVVRVELHRRGIDGPVTELGRMHIANRGCHPDHPRRGDYRVRVFHKGLRAQAVRSGEVENFPRLSYSVWRLVLRALSACFPEERR